MAVRLHKAHCWRDGSAGPQSLGEAGSGRTMSWIRAIWHASPVTLLSP